MDFEKIIDELVFLTGLDAPAGFEEPVLCYIRERFEKLSVEVTADIRGNLYAVKKGVKSGTPVVMVIAHADEIGFMVTGITPGGFLRFVKLGGPTDMVLPGHRVRILGTKGPLDGVIGVKPGHILSGEKARKIPPVNKMYIDICAASKDEAMSWGVETGTPAVFSGELTTSRNSARVFGKAVDDRAGVLALLKAAETLDRQDTAPTVVWCLSVEEEMGLRGAAVAALDAQPDVVIALDTCPAGGTPELETDELPWRIGEGLLIKILETRGFIRHRPLYELFRRSAEKHNIPYQLVIDTAGITDATAAQQAGGKVAAISLGLARRYSHSAVEVLDLNDLQALIDLLVKTLPELKDKKDLIRF